MCDVLHTSGAAEREPEAAPQCRTSPLALLKACKPWQAMRIAGRCVHKDFAGVQRFRFC